MVATTKVLLVFPEDASILSSDVAGRPCVDYLLEMLSQWSEDDVEFVGGVGTHAQNLCANFPGLSKCWFREFSDEARFATGLLVIDARAWLSKSVLKCLLELARSVTTSCRIVEDEANILAAHRKAKTLAVYLSPGQEKRALSRFDDAVPESIFGALAAECPTTVACIPGEAPHHAILATTLSDIAQIESTVMLARAITLMTQGTRIRDPGRLYVHGDLVCGRNVIIDTNVIIEGSVVLGDGVRIGANSILRDCRIGDNSTVNPFSLVEQSAVGAGSFVGPYGRIRPGSTIGDNVQIGNYVEVKNSRVGDGSRINHHTFIGDATLGDKVTIGAGTITCNHDGTGTNQTVIGSGAYIGSGCNLIAPLIIGEAAVVGAGSTITTDVPGAKLTLARVPQVTIDDWQSPVSRRRK